LLFLWYVVPLQVVELPPTPQGTNDPTDGQDRTYKANGERSVKTTS
jgi:hypothetical protein